MPHYDPASVLSVTADSVASSNAIVSAAGPIKVHMLTLNGDGSNALTVDLYNNAIASGTILATLAMTQQYVGQFARQERQVFDPPLYVNVGLTLDLTGNGGTAKVYYSR